MNSIGNDGTKALKVSVFPGEDPDRAPFEEWLDENDSALRGGGYGLLGRGRRRAVARGARRGDPPRDSQ